MNEIMKARINSDRGAIGAVETIILVVLTIGILLVIQGSIMDPIKNKTKEVGTALSGY